MKSAQHLPGEGSHEGASKSGSALGVLRDLSPVPRAGVDHLHPSAPIPGTRTDVKPTLPAADPITILKAQVRELAEQLSRENVKAIQEQLLTLTDTK